MDASRSGYIDRLRVKNNSAGVLKKGVVQYIVNDTDNFSIDENDVVINERYVDSAPANSLLVYDVTKGKSDETLMVLYPMFQSHIQLPVKVGEHVFFLEDSSGLGYYISRVHDTRAVEDLNYTHSPRKFLEDSERTTDQKAEQNSGNSNSNYVPEFNDGGETDETKSFVNLDYEQIIEKSKESIVYDAVPPLKKRLGDLVLHSSYNSSIVLGADRGHIETNERLEESNVGTIPKNKSGTIDIVAGRCQTRGVNVATAQLEITNARNENELDKAPYLNGLEVNVATGDPHFKYDDSRIYVSMNTSPDDNFQISKSFAQRFSTDYNLFENVPAIVLKSDHLRFVARKDDDMSANGSIRLVKEGAVDTDACSIGLEPDGEIHIAGSKIYLGRPSASLKGPGEGGSEPYIMYSALEKLLNDTFDIITNFCTTLETHVTPGFGAPSPQITAAATKLKTEIGFTRRAIVDIKSKRIFGE